MSEVELAPAAPALPTSGSVSYQASWGISRQPSRRPPSPPFISSSPPRNTPNEDSYSREKDISNDENISVLDPRRFTPNLHASLVSEILSLRREIENKNSILGALEENLNDNKLENNQLNEALKAQMAEVRSVKSQMHSLETSTLTALGELAKERDGAVESLSDTQKRLETSKSKARRHEEESERTQRLWDRDRQVWDDEKRNMERKIHVVEGRLKTILTEVAATQSSVSQSPPASTEIDQGMRETWFTKSSDSTSRSNSVPDPSRFSALSNHTRESSDVPNFRFSASTGLNGLGATSLNGLSLAEELEIDEDGGENVEEFDTDDDLASPNALPEEVEMRRRRSSASSQPQDHKARKVLGLVAGDNERLTKEVPTKQRMETIDEKSNCAVEEPVFQFRDIGIQISAPPSSPKLQVHEGDTDTSAEKNIEQSEHTANQRRKRVSVPATVFDSAHFMKPAPSLASPMVSAGCQTLEPLNPLMPINPAMPSVAASRLANSLQEMKCAMTQTNNEDILMMIAAATRDESSMMVPTIAIHPPGSRPPSSHNGVVLPPRTKSVGCQVSIAPPISVKSISVQTEEIRSERRPHKIPPRLLSTKATSKTSWRHDEVKEPARNHVAPRKSSRRNNQRATGDPSLLHARVPIEESIDSYPGNNDNGPLDEKQSSNLRRPIRKQSLFAGFESPSDSEAPAIPEMGFSDDDFATAPPIRKTLSKVQNSWKLVPHTGELGLLPSDYNEGTNDKENAPENVPSRPEPALNKSASSSKPAAIKSSARPPNSFHAAREPNIRRAALISSGTAAYTTRFRSPNAPSSSNKDSLVAPPFPVPTRSSSRRIPISASDGARSPTPYSSNFFSAPKPELGRPPSKNAILRKVRSATAVPRFGRNYPRRSGSRSPPPSTSSFGPESPQPPRLPLHDISSRRARNEHNLKISSPMSFLSASSVIEDPIETSNQSTSVVDAIAQTMVGEWMWKYVRRRKSFGISESPQVEFDAGQGNGETGGGSGIRHKRWVWLAPYERAIMWSSKQPTSGPALLGKSGRKRKWDFRMPS